MALLRNSSSQNYLQYTDEQSLTDTSFTPQKTMKKKGKKLFLVRWNILLLWRWRQDSATESTFFTAQVQLRHVHIKVSSDEAIMGRYVAMTTPHRPTYAAEENSR